MLNCLKKDWWGVFLIGCVITGDEYRGIKWDHTDLAKKWLCNFFGDVKDHSLITNLKAKDDSFAPYIEQWGISATTFGYAKNEETTRILAEWNNRIAAAEVHGRLFFLPLNTIKHDALSLENILRTTVECVLEYRLKNQINLPSWVRDIRFQREETIQSEIVLLREKVLTLETELKRVERYKAVLCTSGTNLQQIGVEIIKEFFGLRVSSDENYVEDALIIDEEGNPIFVVEIKGINGGLKREHINQIDSHRERLNLDQKTPGLLILNDFMKVEGLEARKSKEFQNAHLEHASRMNVKVLRCITLIELMRKSK